MMNNDAAAATFGFDVREGWSLVGSPRVRDCHQRRRHRLAECQEGEQSQESRKLREHRIQ
jgi:hypothetical protein